MSIDRRRFLVAAGALAATAGVPAVARAVPAGDPFAPEPGAWRTFEITTHVQLAESGAAKGWLPVAGFAQSDWIKPIANDWTTDADVAELRSDPRWNTQMLYVEWNGNRGSSVVELRSRVATRDRAIDFAKPSVAPLLSTGDRSLYTSPTALIPTDGIVRKTSDTITAGATTDVDKARRIYEWVVANTFRKATVRGCGIGDIRWMLTSGDMGGKCADINALYVGLARAAGLPARDLYGIRVAPSRFGYLSLGANSSEITKAQHCRAEVWLSEYGWVPVDPADVRKVALEEPPGNRPVDDAKVVDARRTLFGAWETNWIAYNAGHDVRLPGSAGAPVGFLMYPQAEVAGVRSDCLAPDTFAYKITTREITT
jgi:transglutaminase-like putative cysteine protease